MVDKLGMKVYFYFWLDEYIGKDDFVRYWREEWVSGLIFFRKVLSILDFDVVIFGMFVKVIDKCDVNEVYVVWSLSFYFGVCSCSWV